MTGDIEQLLREGMDRATRGVRMRGGLARQAARQVRQRRLASRTAAAAAVMAGTAAVVAGVAGRPGGGTGRTCRQPHT